MRDILITARIRVDEKHYNAPSLEDCETAVWNALSTPDNKVFGILEIEVNVREADLGQTEIQN